MPMNKIRESPLTTADPYHIPRYLGYVPQYKFQIGNTYGQTTHNLLTDKGVATSGKTVLANIDMQPRVQVDKYNEPGSGHKLASIENRLRSFGDRKYHSRMVPGYTGFIPRGQQQIGKRYGQHCVNAIADFIENQDKRESYQSALKKDMTPCSMPQRGEYTPEQMKLWISKDRPPFPITPYKMENNNPDKYFVSGYTGFCPRSRSLLGMGYPHITHKALNIFTDGLKKNAALKVEPPKIHRPPEVYEASPLIYPEKDGMIPHYTGYIPGEKYRFGHTYGHSTIGTLQKTGLRPVTSYV